MVSEVLISRQEKGRELDPLSNQGNVLDYGKDKGIEEPSEK